MVSAYWNNKRRSLPFNILCLAVFLLGCSIQRNVHALASSFHHTSSARNAFPSSSSVVILRASSSSSTSGKDFKRKQDGEKKTPGGSSSIPKRRFGQTAHKQQQQLQEPPDEKRTERRTEKRSSNKKIHNHENENDDDDGGIVQKDLMWKSRKKSIEELETIMTRRWGTDASAWTATDVQDYDDDDDDENNDGKEEESPIYPKFRARPVKDPWQKSVEKKTARENNSNVINKNLKEGAAPSSKFIRSNDKERNSADLLLPRREYYDEDDVGYEATTLASRSSNSEPDEGKMKGRISFNHVISPKPVGGRGYSTSSTKKQVQYDDDDDDDAYSPKRSNRGGDPKVSGAKTNQFFFRDPSTISQQGVEAMKNNKSSSSSTSTRRSPTVAMNGDGGARRGDDDNDDDDRDDAPRERQPQKPKQNVIPKQLVDIWGKPLYLTLQQAERNYKASLLVDNNSNNNDDEEEEDFSADSGADIAAQPSWEDLGITDAILLDNLDAMGCPTPLSVQAKTCLEIAGHYDDNSNHDVVVGTYTGSGKTLAFLVPLAQSILSEKGTSHNDDSSEQDDDDDNSSNSSKGAGIQTIIIAPGRELASQIVSVARELFQGTGLGVMLAIGGTTFDRNLQQIRKRKPDFIVGTPGRIAELIVGRPGERTGRLLNTMTRNKQKLVLDEFDALLEYKPHREPTTAILDTLQQRYGDRIQCVLCSATASDMLGAASSKNRVSKYLRPGFVQIMADSDDILVTTAAGDQDEDDNKGQQTTAGTRVSRTVIHGVVPVPHRRLALETLRRVLHTDPIPQQILIFVHDAYRVDLVVEKLSAMGIVAAALHGGRNSEKVDRADVSKALREGYVGIVVATELAARGLDAPLLTHVINLDLPTDASFYAHRAGRVGRCGRSGVVLNFTTDPKERKVPQKFATKLGIDMHVVDVRSGRLNIVDPTWQESTLQ
jgi:superfamily II DNA/RNA helicase